MKARTSGRGVSRPAVSQATDTADQTSVQAVADAADIAPSAAGEEGAAPPDAGGVSAAATVDEYIDKLGDWRGEAIARVRQIVRDVAPDATESVKWAQPVFESNGPFCYVKAFGKRVNVGFWRGTMLDDPDGLLSGAGNRMKHIKLKSADIPADAVRALVTQAVALNAEHGNPTRRR